MSLEKKLNTKSGKSIEDKVKTSFLSRIRESAAGKIAYGISAFLIPALISCGGGSGGKQGGGNDNNCCVPDPAAVYCKDQGYNLETRNNANGQYGVCIFEDGSECDEWLFFTGQCGQEHSFCEKNGGKISTVDSCNKWYSAPACAVCKIPGDGECYEWDYLNGDCP